VATSKADYETLFVKGKAFSDLAQQVFEKQA